jgi:L,D-transpeptidase YcbB
MVNFNIHLYKQSVMANVTQTLQKPFIYLIILSFSIACSNKKPDVSEKIITDKKRLKDAASVQLEAIVNSGSNKAFENLNLKNKLSVLEYYKNSEFEIKWSEKGKINDKATEFLKLINDSCKFYGLFPKSYAYANLNENVKKLTTTSEGNNAVLWAETDAIFTDVYFQIIKHIKNGRLYIDTNYKYFDSSLHNSVLKPSIESYTKTATTLNTEIAKWEPKFTEYDSLKIALKSLFSKSNKSYTYVKFPYTDSTTFITTLLKRINEDNVSLNGISTSDSTGLSNAIKKWQLSQGITPNGSINTDLISAMNETGLSKFNYAALAMDKLKMSKIKHNGNYVMVNIPSFYLRAYKDGKMAVESKVAVGKSATKTPEMESEISQLILMPNWYVPPSILKIPGYIERHKGRKNFIVKGKTVIQKSGPGNALGEMKFNFKSSDAIYLHDTNERWVFGASRRAVSHGCVRVHQYKTLGDYIAKVSPVFERQYKKAIDKYEYRKDSLGRIVDSSANYKYVPADSTAYTGDSIITRLLKPKVHKELTVGQKVPIYIKYFTCAARNGNLVIYPDVYGYDKDLMEKYFKDLSL